MNQTKIVRKDHFLEFINKPTTQAFLQDAKDNGFAVIITDILDMSALNKGGNKMVRYEEKPLYGILGQLNFSSKLTIAHVGKVADSVELHNGFAIARSFEGFMVLCNIEDNEALESMSTLDEVEAYFGERPQYLFDVRQERGVGEAKNKAQKMLDN